MLRNLIDLLILAALWGGSFLFMRVAAPEFGPVPLMALRVTIAGLFLLPAYWMKYRLAEWKANAKQIFILGIIHSAVPFPLLAYSTLSLTAGFTSILNSTAPLFAAIVGWLWLKDRLTVARVVGLVLGFLGVMVLLWDKASFKAGGSDLAVAAALTAALLYGIGANYSNRRLRGLQPLVVTTGSQFSAALFLLPFAFWAVPSTVPGFKAWASVIALGVICTGIAYLLYFRLIANLGATGAIAVTFLMPVFGMLWGWLFLHEPVTGHMLAATAIILMGTALTTGLIKLARQRRPAQRP
ncbi:MAG: EamA family transporter [Deltaproteobacteria bacterium]|nr:EamA family transporter [Deltaproteobacteria bacterium]